MRLWVSRVGVACAVAVAAALAAQGGSVRVTATKANIRAETNTTSAILTQVNKDTVLELLSVDGDWYHVRIQVGALRLDGYISKTVAKLEPAGPASATAAKPQPEAIPARDGMSVGVMDGSDVRWLHPAPARVIQIAEKVDSIAKGGASVPAGDSLPASLSGSTAITYVWIADGASAPAVVAEKRPSFYVGFKEVPGFSAEDIAPAIVRLTPAASGVRVVGAIRGRADQANRTDADWDVVKDFKQDILKTDVDVAERGVVRLTAAQDLAPGQYAVVMRLTAKKKLSGADVLRTSAAARLFGVVWDFTVK